MKRILFACDLDNTLLYSYQHRKAEDLCVEKLRGKEQGFMTPRTIALLRAVTALADLVPVTTRSMEQYNRISWPAGCTPEYAVVANGALLLKNGEIDASWRRASEPVIAPYREELQSLLPELSLTGRFLRCRIVDDAYLFAYCGKDICPADCAGTYRSRSKLDIVSSGKKLYFFPPQLNKGHALRRLKALMHPVTTVAAGDSIIDTPMLNAADLAILPAFFPEDTVKVPKIKAQGDENAFAEFVLETVCAVR